MSKVSVVIPTYNRANLLQRAINSVLVQTFKDFELIIVDDGSNDNTEDVVNKYNDKRIKYIKHIVNKGQSAALNSGVAESNGVYISFLDSDDEWSPAILGKLLFEFEKDDSLGCVYSLAKLCNSSIPVCNFYLSGNIYKQALAQGYVSHMITLMVKKSCFNKIGGFDESFNICNDDDLCLRLAKKYKFGLVKEILATIHGGTVNQMTKNMQDTANGWWKLYNKFEDDILKECGKHVLSNHYTRAGKLFLKAFDFKMARTALKKAIGFHPTLANIFYYGVTFVPFVYRLYVRLLDVVMAIKRAFFIIRKVFKVFSKLIINVIAQLGMPQKISGWLKRLAKLIVHNSSLLTALKIDYEIHKASNIFANHNDFQLNKFKGDRYQLEFNNRYGYKKNNYEPIFYYDRKSRLWGVEVEGITIYTKQNPCFSLINELRGYTLFDNIGEGDVVIDVGSSNGFISCYFAKKVGGEGTVVCLEPDSLLWDVFAENTRINNLGNIVFMKNALFSKCGDIVFKNKDVGASKMSNIEGKNKVKAIDLNSLFGYSGVNKRRVKLIKLDIEGAEVNVLGDLIDFVLNNPDAVICIASYHVQNDVHTYKIIEKVCAKHSDVFAKTIYPYHTTTFIVNRKNKILPALEKKPSYDEMADVVGVA